MSAYPPPEGSRAETSTGTVALFTRYFLPYSQTFIHDEIRTHDRYQIDVFCQKRANAERFPYDRYVTPGSWIARTLYKNTGYAPRFDRILGEGRHDLVHAHFGTTALNALPYVIRHDLPFIITFHGNDVGILLGLQRLNPNNWRYVLLRDVLMQRADLMLCVSEELRAFVSDMSGRPDAVERHPLGIDLSRYTPRTVENAVPEIIMIGRFTEKKGHRYALQAFARVIRSGRDARLTFVGSGQGEAWCRRFVQANQLDDHVRFAGVMTPPEVAHRLAGSDIALVPSVVARNQDREGSPTVAKEAGACEVPVVGTYHAGIPEIVEDGTTGLLVPERHVPALTDALIRLLDDADLRDRLGRAARTKIRRDFNLQKQVRTLEQYYDRCV